MPVRASLALSTLTAAAVLLCAACTTGPAPTITRPTPSGPRWIVDHVSQADNPDTHTTLYTAWCAPADAFTPAHVPTDAELSPVAISENDFLRLRPGDACPGK